MWYLASTRKLDRLFKFEGEEVAKAFLSDGSEKEALKFIDKNAGNFERYFTSTWQGIVEEVGTATFNALIEAAEGGKKAAGVKKNAFDPWDRLIQKTIKEQGASKVVAVTDHTKEVIQKIIREGRKNEETVDQIGRKIKAKYDDFSRYRAFRIARTEVVAASNYASINAAKQSKVVDYKEWVSSHDDRVRKSHEDVHGQKIPLDEKFKNGLLFPADYSANKPSETIQCRCTIAYFTKEAATAKPKKPVKPKAPAKPKPPKVITRGHIEGFSGDERIEDRCKRALSITEKECKVDPERAKKLQQSIVGWSGSSYRAVRAYEMGKADYVEEYIKTYARDILEYIEKSPKWGDNGELFRGIGVNKRVAESIVQNAKNGDIMDMMGTASWSTSENVAHNFAASDEVSIIFRAPKGSLYGTSMRHISKYVHEDEVLLPHTARYVATEIKKHSDTFIEIFMEEVFEK